MFGEYFNYRRTRVHRNQYGSQVLSDGKTIIHDDVCIGARALIGPGVEIAKGTIIEMGQIVTKEVGL